MSQTVGVPVLLLSISHIQAMLSFACVSNGVCIMFYDSISKRLTVHRTKCSVRGLARSHSPLW